MSLTESVMKCHICGRPYKVYSHTVADQSACGACVREAEEATRRPDTEEERRRRREAFGRLWARFNRHRVRRPYFGAVR